MLGRATQSPQLELVASYVAREFRRFGLKPGGDNGTYLQRYPIERFEVVAESSFVSLAGGATATWRLGRDVLLLGGGPPPDQIAGPAVFVTGTPAPGAAIDSTAIAGKVRSEEHTSELQSPCNLVCRLLLEKKKKTNNNRRQHHKN